MQREALIAGGAAVIVLGLLYLSRKTTAQSVGQTIGSVAVDTGVGAIYGISDSIGLPRTNEAQCDADLAAGRTWEASFSCPAGRYIKSFL